MTGGFFGRCEATITQGELINNGHKYKNNITTTNTHIHTALQPENINKLLVTHFQMIIGTFQCIL